MDMFRPDRWLVQEHIDEKERSQHYLPAPETRDDLRSVIESVVHNRINLIGLVGPRGVEPRHP